MNCPHTTTTTLLWLYESTPEDHALHIANCDECQTIVEEHSDLSATIGPTLASLNTTSLKSKPTHLYASWGAVGFTLLAIAATWLLAVPQRAQIGDTGLSPDKASQTAFTIEGWLNENVDEQLQDIDNELNELSIELITL
jgi:hypothetical protein